MIGSALPRAVTFDCWSTLLSQSDQETPVLLRGQAVVRAASELGLRLSTSDAAEWLQRGWAIHHEDWVRGTATGARSIAGWVLQWLLLH